MPIFDFFSLGLIGVAAALGGEAPLIPALICGGISGGFSALGGQCPAELDSIASKGTKIGVQRVGEVVMISSPDPGECALEMLGDNFCKAHAYATMGTAIGQNQLCVTACETLPQVAIMSSYESCKMCCCEAVLTCLGSATDLLVDVI